MPVKSAFNACQYSRVDLSHQAEPHRRWWAVRRVCHNVPMVAALRRRQGFVPCIVPTRHGQRRGRFELQIPRHAKLEFSTRRGGRVVDRARLESGSTFTGTGSSNLPLSASHHFHSIVLFGTCMRAASRRCRASTGSSEIVFSSPASTTTRPSTTRVLTRVGAHNSRAESASPAPL